MRDFWLLAIYLIIFSFFEVVIFIIGIYRLVYDHPLTAFVVKEAYSEYASWNTDDGKANRKQNCNPSWFILHIIRLPVAAHPFGQRILILFGQISRIL